MSYVIAVAGPVGAGKSSLVMALAKQLGDASILFFDHYEGITRKAPQELVLWLQNGADFNQFNIPGLAEDLEKLKHGEAVTDPVSSEIVAARKYIVFEMPFGKAHEATAPFIDLLIWIDVPLEIALARKLREHTGMFLETIQPEKQRESLSWLHGFLDNYLLFIRDILQVQQNKVRPGADLLLDGSCDPNALSREASQFIRNTLI